MKVLLVNKFLFPKGGAERAVFDMAEILRSSGHEVAFLSTAHPENIQGDFVSEFVRGANYHAKHSFIESFRLAIRVLWNREAEKKMEMLLDRFRPDIVHFHSIYRELSPSILRPVKKRGIPSVMTLHDYALLSPSRILYSRKRGIWKSSTPSFSEVFRFPFVQGSCLKSFVALLENKLHRLIGAYRNVSLFIAPSIFLKRVFEQENFFGNIVHISNPLLGLESRIERAHAERKNPKPSAPFVFVGRLDEEKGIGILLEAFARYSGPSPLFILGSGSEQTSLQAQADALGLIETKKVIFRGATSPEERDETLLSSKAIIVPSIWYENQPYVIMEALSFGVPVLVSDVGALPDMIDQGENGFLYHGENAGSLTSTLEALDRRTESEWSHMKDEAFRRARLYDSDTFLSRLLEIYESLIAKNSSRLINP